MTDSKEISTVSENTVITVDSIKLKKAVIIPTFSDTAKVDKLVAKFGAEALSVIPDMSNRKGRDVIKSMAFKVSQTKTGVIAQMIKPSIEQAKKVISEVGKGKKHFETKMDALRDEVRAPLNKWEADEKIREEKRIDDIHTKIKGIHAIATFNPSNPPGKIEIASLMEAVDSIVCEDGFAEFTQDALQAKSKVKEVLTEKLNAIIQQELKAEAEEEIRLKEVELQKQQVKQKAQERVNNLMMMPVSFFGKSSIEIRNKITSLENYEVEESVFGELTEQAKTSVTTVIAQLSGMLQQQILVEESQAKAEQEEHRIAKDKRDQQQEQIVSGAAIAQVEEKPIEQRLSDKFTDVEPEVSTRKVTGGHIVTVKLTQHQSMLKAVNFWAKDYGIVNSPLNDLLNILNQYK